MWRIRTSIEVVIHINGPVAEGYIFFTEVRQVRGTEGRQARGTEDLTDRGKKNITRGHRSIDWITTDMEVRILHNIDSRTFYPFPHPHIFLNILNALLNIRWRGDIPEGANYLTILKIINYRIFTVIKRSLCFYPNLFTEFFSPGLISYLFLSWLLEGTFNHQLLTLQMLRLY